jgi:DNA-binding CsgD family transcriptional regulator
MTPAELRMAVLMRFGFSGKQIATMLGISPTSVTKGKQRLKARVASRLDSGSGLDSFIANY